MSATWTWNSQSENSTLSLGRPPAGQPDSESFDTANPDTANPLEPAKTLSSAEALQSSGAQTVLAQSPLIAAALQGWQWLVARCKGGAPAAARPTLRVLSQLALGGRKTLTLIDLEGQRYLVGGGSDSVTAILAIQPDTEAPRETIAPSTRSTARESA